jgi:hypothetical protein
MFQLCMERFTVKNIPCTTKYKCYKDMGLCALNLLTTLGSTINTIAMAYVVALREKQIILHFDLL